MVVFDKHLKRQGSLIFLSVVALVLVGSALVSAYNEQPPMTKLFPKPEALASVQVEASLFSGRRNPTWHLSPTQASEFERRLAQLPVGRPQPAPDSLGYRGLNVRITEQPTNAQSTIFVYKDVIRVTHQGATQTYYDTGQRVEHWLVQSAQEHVPMDIFGILTRVIQ